MLSMASADMKIAAKARNDLHALRKHSLRCFHRIIFSRFSSKKTDCGCLKG